MVLSTPSAENAAKFTYPTAGFYGAGRNSFRGPSYFNIDTSLVKKFKIMEGHSITFRAEAYNMLNKTNFNGFGTNINTTSTFGKFSSARTARIMQLTLRYDF